MALYSNETSEIILARILSRVSSKFDKRIGSIIYDAEAPTSIELSELYSAIDYALDQTFADSSEREYLIRRAAERGLSPEPATNAKVTGLFTPASLNIAIGSRFTSGEYTYRIDSKIADGQYYLLCETEGSAANSQNGRLIPVETIVGLKTAEITEVSILGEDEEDTEALRSRYFSSLKADAYGGNVADYRNKIRSLNGVGGVKVYPAWNGGSTILCVIVDSEYGIPTETLVNSVQLAIDPLVIEGEDSQGQGRGIAPIGHYVTIIGANETPINISTLLTFGSGFNYESMREEIESTLEYYYQDINGDWENRDNVVVRIAEINSRLLSLTGIVDISGTTLNGGNSNITISSNNIPTRGTFIAR